MPIELGMGEVSSYSVPSGFRADLHARPEGPSLMGWDGMDGMDGMGWMGWMGRNIKSVL